MLHERMTSNGVSTRTESIECYLIKSNECQGTRIETSLCQTIRVTTHAKYGFARKRFKI